MDDLGFINHFVCNNKAECVENGVEIYDIESKWYWRCKNIVCRRTSNPIKFDPISGG